MSQFFGSEEMPVGLFRLFAKSATLGGSKLHGSNQRMETNPLTFAKAVQKAEDNGTNANSISCNILPISPLSTRFCRHDKRLRSRKLLKINNLTEAVQETRGVYSPIGSANSLFQNILPISPLFIRFCGRKQRSLEGKHFRIKILTESREKKQGRGTPTQIKPETSSSPRGSPLIVNHRQNHSEDQSGALLRLPAQAPTAA